MIQLKYDNLIGLPFVLNEQDCFTMFKNFYEQNFGIEVPNYARPNDWDADQLDLIGMLYKQVGMEKVDTWDLRPGDVLATAIGSSNPNHLVIFVGGNTLIDHKINSLSGENEFRPFWKMVTCYVLRHPEVPDLREVLPDVTIEELLAQRYQLETS